MSKRQLVEYQGSVSPDEWGPQLWSVLHKLPESVKSVDKLSKCFGNLCLPCAECQSHYESFVAKRPPGDIVSRTQAFDWIFDLHNEVNSRLGKPLVLRSTYLKQRSAARVGQEIASRAFISQ